MSETTETAAVPAERGRYAVYGTADGGLLISRAGPLCQRCQDCGCGEQLDPIGPVSGAIVKLARAAAEGKLSLPGALKKMMRT